MGMRVTRDTSASPMRFFSRRCRRVVPTVSIPLTSSLVIRLGSLPVNQLAAG